MKKRLMDLFGWGLILWVIGYLLGIIFFMILPRPLIGWAIMPIATVITVWILFNKIKSNSIGYYVLIGMVWAAIAVGLDYIFIVKLLNPPDGYYKLDVHLYYLLTLTLPVTVGLLKSKNPSCS